jgi:hypothetical protein
MIDIGILSLLVQFLMLWQQAGATHFIFYYHSASEQVMRVLRLFDTNLITLIKYASPKTPVGVKSPASAMFNDGQVESTTECAWRVTGWAKYAAFVDIDDLLLVRNGNGSINLVTLLNRIDAENERSFHNRRKHVLPVCRHGGERD